DSESLQNPLGTGDWIDGAICDERNEDIQLEQRESLARGVPYPANFFRRRLRGEATQVELPGQRRADIHADDVGFADGNGENAPASTAQEQRRRLLDQF